MKLKRNDSCRVIRKQDGNSGLRAGAIKLRKRQTIFEEQKTWQRNERLLLAWW
jgi:hypothetical protein